MGSSSVATSHSHGPLRSLLWQVDGVTNSLVDSVYFPDMPIRTARFTGDGKQVGVGAT